MYQCANVPICSFILYHILLFLYGAKSRQLPSDQQETNTIINNSKRTNRHSSAHNGQLGVKQSNCIQTYRQTNDYQMDLYVLYIVEFNNLFLRRTLLK